MEPQKINLLDFDRPSLREYFQSLNEKPFHADQVIQWIHQEGITDFQQMTNLSKTLRAYLAKSAEVAPLQPIQHYLSQDGTHKWLFQLSDHKAIETVFIPEEGRGTLCISSQVGCPLGCTFCATGQMGYKRNLTPAEIIGQVWSVIRYLSQSGGRHDHRVTNIVLMGMGEPLLNVDAVLKATRLMTDDLAYGLSKHRVTLSTVGIVPEIKRLSQDSDIALAVSLHAPNDTLRHQLIPISRQYPLKDLIAACKDYFKNDPRRKVTFEYVMLRGVNDRVEQAKELVKLLQGMPCKVNLLLFNSVPFLPYEPSLQEDIEVFQHILVNAGINTRTRRRRGGDIQAACGQLAGKPLPFEEDSAGS